jgi:hypothetical protein
MQSEQRFHRIQQRAYEIYKSREPKFGSADEDWRKAEQEIEREEQFSASDPHGVLRWKELLMVDGKDIENPT